MPNKKKKEPSDDIKKAFKEIYKLCKKEDDEIRKALVKQWKKHEEFWHGVQYIFWSEQDATWISPVDTNWRDRFTDEELEEIGPFYDYVIDIYRAHGESIIAALSAQIPALRFIPDDVSNTDDVTTARTYSVIADLVSRHNKAKMLFLRALFFLWNGGIVASYRYKDADPSYGTYKVPKYETVETPVTKLICEDCGYEQPTESTPSEQPEPEEQDNPGIILDSGDNIPEGNNPEQDESQQVDEGVSEELGQDGQQCPQCGGQIIPEETTEEVPIKTGDEVLPKTRVKVDIVGPLFFKTNYYAKKQEECSYFIYWIDTAKSIVKSVYCEDFKDSDLSRAIDGERLDSLDRFSRSGHAYPNDPTMDEQELVTVSKVWFRPSEYWRCKDESIRLKLAKEYPLGAQVTFIGKNDTFAEASAEAEDMFDTKWEIGQAGLSTYLTSDPIGKPLMPVQEMKNQVSNLTMDILDHSNPDSFADPEVLNFDQYGKNENRPGTKYPIKPKAGKPIGESFYEGRAATLSGEIVEVNQELDKAGQFTVGSFPSLYGGSGSNTSRTAKEYEQSRAMALQRLTIIWTFVVDWWVRTIEGCVRTYASIVTEDERFTKWDNGNYINVWIRFANLSGKVGGVESEASEQFPVSLLQKKSLILDLMEKNIPQVNTALYTPENSRILQDVLALNEFKLPGEVQRLKQVIEISELTKEGAQPLDKMTPSIPIDVNVDDDAVHIAVCKNWAVDLPGLDCMKLNPKGYMNVILHMKMHELNLLQKTMQMQPGAMPGQQPQTSEPPVE